METKAKEPKDEVNKSEEIQKILDADPKISAKEVIGTLAEKGITVAASLVILSRARS